MANQIHNYRHDKMADQFRYSILYFVVPHTLIASFIFIYLLVCACVYDLLPPPLSSWFAAYLLNVLSALGQHTGSELTQMEKMLSADQERYRSSLFIFKINYIYTQLSKA